MNPITGEVLVEASTDIADPQSRELDDFRVATDDLILLKANA